MYAAMNEKENAQCFGVVRRKPSRGRPAAALWPKFLNFVQKLRGPSLTYTLRFLLHSGFELWFRKKKVHGI